MKQPSLKSPQINTAKKIQFEKPHPSCNGKKSKANTFKELIRCK